MNKYVKIINKGIIDPKSFTIIGLSNKTNKDGFIGQWGSGLKYAIAFLLRHNIPFKVYSDYTEIKFSITKEVFRGDEAGIICVNGEKTSISINLGFDNNEWVVIREIFSNAIDEGEANIKIIESEFDLLEPIEDYTCFYIQADNFKEIINNWNLYFSENRKDVVYYDSEDNRIYSGGENLIIYRKGIRCHFEKEKSIFSYDMSWVDINESRTLKNEYLFRYELVGFLRAINDDDVIHRIIYNINNFWEKCLDWQHKSHVSFSNTWIDVIGEKYLIPYENAGFWDEEIKYLKDKCIILPNNLIEALKIQFGDKIRTIGDSNGVGKGDKKIIDELSKREQSLLSEAIIFLTDAGYKIGYPIKVCKFARTETLGQAENETIFLSDKVFTMGKREIINTIIEENQHLKTGFKDETRAMQTDLINLSISFMEEKIGVYL